MTTQRSIHLVSCLLSATIIAACGDDSGSAGEEAGTEASSTTSTSGATDAASTTSTTAVATATDSPTTTEGSTTLEASTSTGSDTSGAVDSSSGEPVVSASIRVFHAAIQSDGNPDAGFGAGSAIDLDLDVYVDGELALEDLALTDASARIDVTSGTHEISLNAAETDDELFTGTASFAEGESTVIVYNAAADFTARAVELELFTVDEASIEAAAGEAAFVAVHLDGNGRDAVFRTYDNVHDAADVVQLGDAYAYGAPGGSGVYGAANLLKTYLGVAEPYAGGFDCDTPAVTADASHILVWGTNSVAPPGTLGFSTNAFVLAADSVGAQPAINCVPQQ